MVTVWALCYVSQVTPEHFLRCRRVHRPAEGTTACKASSIWMPGPEVKVLVLSQLYFYPFLRLFRRFALTDFNFFMWIYRVTLTYFFFVKLFFTNYPKKANFYTMLFYCFWVTGVYEGCAMKPHCHLLSKKKSAIILRPQSSVCTISEVNICCVVIKTSAKVILSMAVLYRGNTSDYHGWSEATTEGDRDHITNINSFLCSFGVFLSERLWAGDLSTCYIQVLFLRI